MRPFTSCNDARVVLAACVAALGVSGAALSLFMAHGAAPLLWPLVMIGRPLAALVCGLLVLLLARGLARGLRTAWIVTLGTLAEGIIAAPTYYPWAVPSMIIAILLWLHRHDFAVGARAPWRGSALMLTALAMLLVMASHSVTHRAHRHYFGAVTIVDAASHRSTAVHTVQRLHPNGDWPHDVLTLGGILVLLIGARGLTLPARPRAGGDAVLAKHAKQLYDEWGANNVGYFATIGTLTLWSDNARRGLIAYRVIGTTALVAGDPIAAPDDLPEVIAAFQSYCKAHGWTPAFYQTRGDTLPLYRRHGMNALTIGQEAIIDLPSFTLTGKRIANVRHSVTHAERAGLVVRVYAEGELDPMVRAELVAISREWLAGKGHGEMGFTMGQLGPDGTPSPGARVAIAYDADSHAQAFITLLPAGAGRGWMLDLMRRRTMAVSGTMDLLLARTAEVLRDEGWSVFSLSLAPLASSEDDDEDALALAQQGRTLLYERMSGQYSYRSLYNYKRKFNVSWESRYLVYAGAPALPAAIYATVQAHLPARRLLPAMTQVPRPLRRLPLLSTAARSVGI